MLADQDNKQPCKNSNATPKLRTACENCRQSKVKCNLTGKNICTRCLRHGLQCRYGFANRSGKPKGSKNRATLRKMGQLQDGKKPMVARMFGEGNCGQFVLETKPVIIEQHIDQMGHGADSVDENRLLKTRLSQSPSNTTVDTPIISNTPMPDTSVMLNGFDDPSSLGDLFDSTGQFSAGLGYPQISPSLEFLQMQSNDPVTKEMANYPLPLQLPYSLQPTCECFGIQVSHMNQISQMVSDTSHLRFDESLHSIKSALSACRAFLQCTTCHKDSTNLLFTLTVLDLALQLFEHWISSCNNNNSSNNKPPTQSDGSVRDLDNIFNIRYGNYELCPDESRRIRTFLIRSLLFQCKDVLGILKNATIDSCVVIGLGPQQKIISGFDPDTYGFFPSSLYDEVVVVDHQQRLAGDSTSHCSSWLLNTGSMDGGHHYSGSDNNNSQSSGLLGTSTGIGGSNSNNNNNNNNCLQEMVIRYEATVDGLLQSVSSDCICGS